MNSLFEKLDLQKVKSVSLYINLESVLGNLLRENFEDLLKTNTKQELMDSSKSLIANIINLAAHYRAYFTRSKVFSNIVFFYNDFDASKLYNNSIYVKNYRSNYFKNYHNDNLDLVIDMIISSIKIASGIIDFLDCIYIVSSDTIESSAIPYYIHKDSKLKADLNLILSKDKYDFQYVNHDFMILYPDKEESLILHKKNIIPYLRFKNNYDDKYKVEINPKLLPFIHSVLGDKKRSLPKVTGIGFKKLYKAIEKLYLNEYIFDEDPNTLSIEHLAELIKTNNGLYDLDIRDIITHNYFCIDLDRQINIASKPSYDLIMDRVINRFDNNGLKRLNDHTFSDYPLYLIELNNYTKDTVFKDLFN